MSLSRSFSKGVPQPPNPPPGPPRPPGAPPRPPAAAFVVALPLGKTTIMGSIFLSAIRLSRTTWATPCLVHSSFSLPPMPWSKYSTGYFWSLGIAGRRINLHPAFRADGLGFVIDPFEFAVLGAFARLVESFRHGREGRFVVRAERDGAAKSAATAAAARCALAVRCAGGGCGGRLSLRRLRHRVWRRPPKCRSRRPCG